MERRDRLATSDGQSHSDVTVTGYLRKDIPGLWPYIEEFVEKAVRDGLGQHSVEDIYQLLTESGPSGGPLMQCWIAYKRKTLLGIALTEVYDFPSQKTCFISYLAGSDLDTWLQQMQNTIAAWAEELDCDNMLAYVWRPGLERKLRGWKPGPRVMVKELK